MSEYDSTVPEQVTFTKEQLLDMAMATCKAREAVADKIVAMYRAENAELKEKLKIADEALEKYGNEESYYEVGFYDRYREVPGHLFLGKRTEKYQVMRHRILEEDKGKVAREALAKIRGEK